MIRKFVDGAVISDGSLGERQIRVIANSGQSDRVGDVLVASGCKLDRYRANPIVLADHDPTKPIGTSKAYVSGDRVEALVTFAPRGASQKADGYCDLAKTGVLGAVSVGFRGLDGEPIRGGGWKYTSWEMLELSLVAVPCDSAALVIQRSMRKTGRVLSNENADLLAKVAKCLTKSEAAHAEALGALEESDRHRRKAMRQAARIAANAGADAVGEPEDDVDVELALAAGRRKREIEILALASPAVAGDPYGSDRLRRLAEIQALAG